MVMVNDGMVLCPECGSRMYKAGQIWSGRKQVQRYACPACGRKAMGKPADGDAPVHGSVGQKDNGKESVQ